MTSELPKTDWIWKNGEYVRWDDAQIHVMSHVVHYGSSVFEGIRVYRTGDGPAVLRLRDHIRRFADSARIYRMDLGYSIDELSEACLDLIRRNGVAECYIRPVAFRGVGALGLNPHPSPVETYLVCWPWGAYLGADALKDGVDACVSSWQRPSPNTYPTLAKAGGHYMNAQLMKMEAAANGYAEAIALSPSGLVSEGSGQNIFLVRDGTVITPRLDGTMLAGITRDCVLELAADEGIPVSLEAVAREALYVADEVFFSGTAAEITPVRSIDRIPVADGKPGPVTQRLQRSLLEIARGERPDAYGWLTYAQPPSQKANPHTTPSNGAEPRVRARRGEGTAERGVEDVPASASGRRSG